MSDVKIAVLYPSQDTCQTVTAYCLSLAMGYMGKNHPEADVAFYTNNGTIIAENRTALSKIALLDGADWTVWFDSDMRFPKDTIARLVAHQKPIVAANYPSRRFPVIEPTAFFDDETQIRVYTAEESKGLEPVAAVGFGCIAIHRKVYEGMEPPWFHTPWDEEAQKWEMGEDIYFCRKARGAGFEVLVDHDLSKEVAHIGQMEWTYKEAFAMKDSIAAVKHKLVDNKVQAVVKT